MLLVSLFWQYWWCYEWCFGVSELIMSFVNCCGYVGVIGNDWAYW